MFKDFFSEEGKIWSSKKPKNFLVLGDPRNTLLDFSLLKINISIFPYMSFGTFTARDRSSH